MNMVVLLTHLVWLAASADSSDRSKELLSSRNYAS
jgi:hypothetical protein